MWEHVASGSEGLLGGGVRPTRGGGEETEAGLTGNDTRDMNRNSQQMAGAAAVQGAPV